MFDSSYRRARFKVKLLCVREGYKKRGRALAKLPCNEDTKWDQRAKVKQIQEGGNNTKYFHLIANGKHRKKRIYQLEKR
jgi:hypothetical protein